MSKDIFEIEIKEEKCSEDFSKFLIDTRDNLLIELVFNKIVQMTYS